MKYLCRTASLLLDIQNVLKSITTQVRTKILITYPCSAAEMTIPTTFLYGGGKRILLNKIKFLQEHCSMLVQAVSPQTRAIPSLWEDCPLSGGHGTTAAGHRQTLEQYLPEPRPSGSTFLSQQSNTEAGMAQTCTADCRWGFTHSDIVPRQPAVSLTGP